MSEKDTGPEACAKGVVEGVEGKIKKATGALTGREGLRREGEAQQEKADAQRDVAAKEAEAEHADISHCWLAAHASLKRPAGSEFSGPVSRLGACGARVLPWLPRPSSRVVAEAGCERPTNRCYLHALGPTVFQ